jgi:type I restriction enzyme S subunit
MTDGSHKLPSGWRWVRLGETTSLIRSGFAFGKKGAAKGDLLHLRPYNIGVDGTLDLSQQFLIPSASKSNEEVLLQPGDVLFNNTNSVELVGKSVLVREPINAAFSNHITLMRTYANLCVKDFLAAWLFCPAMQ